MTDSVGFSDVAAYGAFAAQKAFGAGAAIVTAVLFSAALAGCDTARDDWSWNQKLTVEVTTPAGVRTGSAVTYVGWNDADVFDNYAVNYRGEATVVELGDGRFLFALIGEPTRQIAAYTLHDELGARRNDYPSLFPKIEAFRGTRDVPRDRYPMLVTFTDIADPKTVRKVDPANLAATFGPGVSLRRITLEITDEKVAEGKIESVLPWWCKFRNAKVRLSGQSGPIADNELSNILGTGAFKIGDCT